MLGSSRVSWFVAAVALLGVVLVDGAGADNRSCAETERDAYGNCPKPKPTPKPDPKPPKPAPTPRPPTVKPRPTGVDIRADAGARVTVDGIARGQAPLVVETTAGRHLVELAKTGFTPHSEWVEVKAGEVKAVAVRLTPAGSAPTTPATTPAVKPGTCPSGMVLVPAGTFTMGDVEPGRDGPQHTVTIDGYCIDKTEVTVAAYARCVTASSCAAAIDPAKDQRAKDPRNSEALCNGTRSVRQDHPVNCIDWNQATAFCAWAGKRLPTEAEWEYAARGADGRLFPWGNEAPSATRLNACGSECEAMWSRVWHPVKWTTKPLYDANDGWEATAPTGSFPAGASPFGVLDMAGNVREWTSDWFGPYAAGAITNPTGATSGTERVARGGTWNEQVSAYYVRGTHRVKHEPKYLSSYVGFRCARGN